MPKAPKPPKPPSPAVQQIACDRWNARHSVGIPVHVTLDDGSSKATITRSAAWLMGGHTAVIMLDGFSGGYSLDRVHAAQ